MSAFDPDDFADLDEEQLDELDGLSDEELAAYLEGDLDRDPLAGYARGTGRRRLPDARHRGITDLPAI